MRLACPELQNILWKSWRQGLPRLRYGHQRCSGAVVSFSDKVDFRGYGQARGTREPQDLVLACRTIDVAVPVCGVH